MDKNNIKHIINLIKPFLNDDGYNDVVEIANSLGIKVYDFGFFDRMSDKASFIKYNKNNNHYEIYVNNEQSPQRQRFSIAHEIGHYILHKELIKEKGQIDREGKNSIDGKQERLADRIASHILAPTKSVNSFLRDNKADEIKIINGDLLNKFIKKFNISKSCALIRLRDMGYYVGHLW
ncbi:MAG: ImmA/IrrE family metallo-endopeptidase [Rickettsiales bacterium]|jgi:Zn-dependent peptidase ImmA (M78 family)|nr:ImmA/IrrE family metallo-endopeptidase [Rickettsiales bacterium]